MNPPVSDHAGYWRDFVREHDVEVGFTRDQNSAVDAITFFVRSDYRAERLLALARVAYERWDGLGLRLSIVRRGDEGGVSYWSSRRHPRDSFPLWWAMSSLRRVQVERPGASARELARLLEWPYPVEILDSFALDPARAWGAPLGVSIMDAYRVGQSVPSFA